MFKEGHIPHNNKSGFNNGYQSHRNAKHISLPTITIPPVTINAFINGRHQSSIIKYVMLGNGADMNIRF